MLGRGTFLTTDKVLPGIYVRCNFNKSSGRASSIKLYALKDGDSIQLKLTNPYRFTYEDDENGTISISSNYGYSLYAIDDGEGTITIGVNAK